jgi:hypothetical protein
MAQFLLVDSNVQVSYNCFSGRGFLTKIEHNGASKRKTKQDDFILQSKWSTCRTTRKKKRKKEEAKILHFMGKANNLRGLPLSTK